MQHFIITALLLALPMSIDNGSPRLRLESMARVPEEAGNVWGVFVQSTGDRFDARLLGGGTEQFELMPRGRIARNGRTVQLSDLRPGDDLVISTIRPLGRLVWRPGPGEFPRAHRRTRLLISHPKTAPAETAATRLVRGLRCTHCSILV